MAQFQDETLPLIKVVGVSASGKSTLVQGLRLAGYNARPVSQEHSNIADLWQQFGKTRVLIYLYADLESQRRRRPDVVWGSAALRVEESRLAHARAHADLRINTSGLAPQGALQIALIFLKHHKIRRASHSLPPVSITGSVQQ
jgi:hypothetical protein